MTRRANSYPGCMKLESQLAGKTPDLVRYSPGRDVLFATLAVVIFLGSGCSSGKVLNSANDWAYYTSRWNEECFASSTLCECRHEALARWRKLLDEARDAVQRGGKYPLQIKALRTAETKFKECR